MKTRLSITLACLALSITGCNKPDVAVNIRPKQYVVVVDLSASRDVAVQKEGQDFVERLASQLSYGDDIVLIQMQQNNLIDIPLRLPFHMPLPRKGVPTSRDKQDLEGEQQTVIDSLPRLFQAKNNERIQHTDIFATLKVVEEKVHDRKTSQSSEIIFLSDMLQSAQGFEMERLQRMPSTDWIEKRKQANELPSLAGACIAVIGVDTSRKEASVIRGFWQDYFKAGGAHLESDDVRATAPDSVKSLCHSATG